MAIHATRKMKMRILSHRFANLGNHYTINGYVQEKMNQLPAAGMTFGVLFEKMFSETSNVMFEYSENNRIVEITYGESRKSTLKKAAALRAQLGNLPYNSVVGLYMENSRDWIEVFWSILLCGFRPLVINRLLDHEHQEAALRQTDACCVIVDTDDVEFSMRVLRAQELNSDVDALVHGETGAEILMMSSGTSDHIKICAYTAEAFRTMIEDSYHIIQCCPQMKRHYKGRLKLLTFLPFYHVFGLVAVYIWFAFFSRTFVLLKNQMPRTILNTIRRHEVTHVFAVPLLWNKTYEQALHTIRERGEDTWRRFERGLALMKRFERMPRTYRLLSRVLFREIRQNLFGDSIRFLISGGSEIKPCVIAFFNSIGYHLSNGYGMTEIGITSVELSDKPGIRNGGSIGRPFSSVEYRIDSHGQLLVRNSGRAHAILMDGAWTEPGDEWFETGDLAEYRKDGFHILGRKDDLVISPSGENLNPNIIEGRLQLEGIREMCLIGVRDDRGVLPTLIATPVFPLPVGGLAKVDSALKERIRAEGLERQIGRVLLVRESLMSEGDIKLNRAKIARRLQEGGFTLLTPDGEKDSDICELKDQVRQLFAEVLNKSADVIGDHSDFFLNEGGTSLDYFGLLVKMQDRYGIQFPSDAGNNLNTVSELAAYITRTVSPNE